MSRFAPSESLRKKLVKGSEKLVGFPIYDCRWDGRRGCLCIYEKDRRGNETIRVELREDALDPNKTKTFEYEVEMPAVDEGGNVIGMTVEQRVVDVPLDPEDEDYEPYILGSPRQLSDSDVSEALDAARYKEQMARAIMEKLSKQKDQIREEQFRVREDYTTEAAKEMAKIFQQLKSGKNATVDYGHHTEAGTGSIEGFVVNDRRRVN